MKNKTDFTIDDSHMTQGVAIVCMIMEHLYWLSEPSLDRV